MNFPKQLDGAEVLFYTEKGDYGDFCYTTGELVCHVKYLAICQYGNDPECYYLFSCDEDCEVVSDSMWMGVMECKQAAESSYQKKILWKETLKSREFGYNKN